ncbi:SDR family oxidoreductase [Paractinoplanes atraurantiacus]|uniref:NADP-dependent 3-hydroxy acid dehydrogenase YdfG n=1 Tax=Paractinoplanes atraurantiacus TaxID=1036182 RepID=A0A285FRK6_9ACTN|nr:SDR family NAD(P)-dependent oxidoreductase [Actinoplanes atraurantiacus]SNY12831.1 NADP-dependent 3-hydroxy acid dehydrogenase YdfG [Actinoplanes atraurantiacus]
MAEHVVRRADDVRRAGSQQQRQRRDRGIDALLKGRAEGSTDVTRRGDLHDLVALAKERFGRLDVLVSNAGIGPVSALGELRVDDWDRMVDVNVKGVLHGIAAALPVFRAKGGGHFVTVASTAATKAAVRVICEGLRQEAGESLRVTLVTPGMVRTGFGQDASEDVRAWFAAMADLGIGPEAIADAIAYAISRPQRVGVGEIVVRPAAQA